jgi:prepilin-type N-terminal cleavage/methylation domain-containing protein
MHQREAGFTLIEMLVVVAISAMVLTFGVTALRNYWFVQALSGSVDTVTTQMRQAQQQAESESHPLVYGVWFINVGDSSRWGTLQYDPDPALSVNCSEIGKRSFSTGVQVQSVSFVEDAVRTSECRSALGAAGVPSAGSAEIAFFYARGTATPGSITLEQTHLGRSESLSVTGITGRVSDS